MTATDIDAAEIAALLRRVSNQLDQLPAAIAAAMQCGSPPLSRVDRQVLEVLLPVLATSNLCSVDFTAGDALQHTRAMEGVQEALQAAIGPTHAPGAARRLGRLLGRVEGVVLDGLHVARSGEVREGVLWRVSRV